MARRANLRASDSDREFVAERLRQAAAEGRLLAEELEARLARALRARTYAELDPLVADLPAKRERRSRQLSVVQAGGILMAAIIGLAVVGTLAVLAVMVLTGIVFAWGFWIALAWLFMGRARRRGFCGAPRRRPPRVHYAHRRTLL